MKLVISDTCKSDYLSLHCEAVEFDRNKEQNSTLLLGALALKVEMDFIVCASCNHISLVTLKCQGVVSLVFAFSFTLQNLY